MTGVSAPDLAAPSEFERIADDLWAMGLTPQATVMELLRDELRSRAVLCATDLETLEGGRITVAGVVTHRQHPETARGAVFLNLEDETGHVNVVFSRGAWARWESVAGRHPLLEICGTLEKGQGATNVVAEHVRAMVAPAPSPGSRDFR